MATSLPTNVSVATEHVFHVERHDQLQLSHEDRQRITERTKWVLDSPDPPGFRQEILGSIRNVVCSRKNKKSSSSEPPLAWVVDVLRSIFPILSWAKDYKLSMFKSDLLSGLTLASLCIPQSIGYAALAQLNPQYGLYTSVVPPLIYTTMGTSRELAIGPVAVISLLISAMVSKVVNPVVDPVLYTKLVFTVTFFTGAFQALFGLFRLGFLVDFLSQAAIVGFMAGAAIVIGLQQLKGLLAISHFTTKTDVVSVLIAVIKSFRTSVMVPSEFHPWMFIPHLHLDHEIYRKEHGKRNRKLFWLPAIAPLVSVILSTAIVYLTKADEHGVKIIKHVKGGLNPSSINQLQFDSPHLRESVKIGLVCAIIALTEAVAVGRSFATIKGYNMDGNKEMIAMGVMNIAGSMSSCYVATGSFSRTAVNFYAGCQTAVSNVVMAITVLVMLQLLTGLLYYTPVAILSSIILSALPGLINYTEAYNIWKVDKLDFLACAGAFFGVLFASVEMGLMVAVAVSFAKIILNALRPRVEELGRLPGTDIFCEVDQYPVAHAVPGVLIIRLNSGLLCFTNANPLRDRILKWVAEENEKEAIKRPITGIILDMSSVNNIDYAGTLALEEINKKLLSGGIKLAIASPRWQVIHKLKVAKFVDKVGRDCIFLTVSEAVDSFVGSKFNGPANCVYYMVVCAVFVSSVWTNNKNTTMVPLDHSYLTALPFVHQLSPFFAVGQANNRLHTGEELARDPSAFELFLLVHQNKKKMKVIMKNMVSMTLDSGNGGAKTFPKWFEAKTFPKWFEHVGSKNETAYGVGHSDRYARQQSIEEHNEDPFQDLDTVRLEQNLIKTELKIEKLHKKQIQKNAVTAQSSSSD
ncbi:low affinity sulfate transporter 3-like protein [Tanacetum coccineum]